MKATIDFSGYSEMQLKKFIGINFCVEAGVMPQINRLLEIDRFYTLKILVIIRNELQIVFGPFMQDDKNIIDELLRKKDHERIADQYIRINNYRNSFVRNPKTEELFHQVYNEMVNMGFLFLNDNLLNKVSGIDYYSNLRAYLEKHELVFGSIQNKNLTKFIRKNELNYAKQEIEGLSKIESKRENLKDGLLLPKNDADELDTDVAKTSEDLMISENDIMTRQEAIEFFSISYPTLWRWENEGKIPKAIRVGKKVYWKRSTIEDFIKNGK